MPWLVAWLHYTAFAGVLSFAIAPAAAETVTPSSYASGGRYKGTEDCAPPILDQHHCGGCYAFAATTMLGASYCKQFADKKFLAASPQLAMNMVFQSNEYTNPCGGGLVDAMYDVWVDQPAPQIVSTCEEGCTKGCLPFRAGECTQDVEFDGQERTCFVKDGEVLLPPQTCHVCPSFLDDGCENNGSNPLTFSDKAELQLVEFVDENVKNSHWLGDYVVNGDAIVSAIQGWLPRYGPVAIYISKCVMPSWCTASHATRIKPSRLRFQAMILASGEPIT